jgi:hypothetical protein
MEKLLLANLVHLGLDNPVHPNSVTSAQFRLNGVIIGHEQYEKTHIDELRPILLAAGYLEDEDYEDEPVKTFSKPGEFRCAFMANDPRWQDNERSGIG